MARRLSNRERYAVYAASIAICLFVIVQFILFPAIDNKARLKRSLQVKTKVLEEMRGLQAEFDAIKQKSEQLKRRFATREKGFTLFSFLDRLARDTGIKNQIAYMKPASAVQKKGQFKISTVEMKIQAVSLSKLADYLYEIETSKNMVTIKRASFVKKGKGKGLIDAVLQVETVEI